MMHRAALLCTLCAWLAAGSAAAGELVVVVHGVDSGDGDLDVTLYGEAQRATFPYAERGVIADLKVPARTLAPPSRQATVSLGELAPGSYAVSVIHDVNGNGDVDFNMIGLPTEGWGFSNGARGTLGPPSFDAAAVHVGPATTRIEITLNH